MKLKLILLGLAFGYQAFERLAPTVTHVFVLTKPAKY